MSRRKDVLTTGEVARLCNVAPRTVSKWFDSGQLQGYRIPGSKDRRIPLSNLVRFMKEHEIPMDALRSGRTRVLIVDQESETTATLARLLGEQTEYDVRTVGSGFAAGIECEKFRPHAILLDMHLDDLDGNQVRANIRANDELQMTKIVAMSAKLTDGQAHQLLSNGFDGYLKKPFTVRQAIEAVEQAVAIVY